MAAKDKYAVSAALWLAMAGTAWAHPPYVAPWKYTAALLVSGIAGAGVALAAEKKTGAAIAVFIGLAVFLLCGFAGGFLAFISSM